MLNLKFKERRISSRKRLSGLMPGKLILKENEKQITCKPVDISDHGIGVIVGEILTVGTALELQAKHHNIPLEIIWSQPDFGKNDLFRYGLVCPDETINLEQIFIEYGCLTVD